MTVSHHPDVVPVITGDTTSGSNAVQSVIRMISTTSWVSSRSVSSVQPASSPHVLASRHRVRNGLLGMTSRKGVTDIHRVL